MTINFHSLGNLPHAKEISRSLSIVLLGVGKGVEKPSR